MFKFTNPHPEGKRVGDCVKRACCLASEINYHDIAVMLNRYKKISGAKVFNTKDNDRPFVEKVLLGRSQGNMQFANDGCRYTVSDYAEICKRSIVMVAKHLVCCDGEGDYLDTWDCGWKSIYRAFAIPPYEVIVKHIRTNYPKLCKGLTLERIHL